MRNFKELSPSELETSGGIDKKKLLFLIGGAICPLLLGPYLLGNYFGVQADKSMMLSSSLNINTSSLIF